MRHALAMLSLVVAGGCADETRRAERAAAEEAAQIHEAAVLHAEYSALGGADRLRRYGAGVTVRGTVATVDDHGAEEGGVAVRLDGAAVVLRFADRAAAEAVGVRQGAAITARCAAVEGMTDGVLYVEGCGAP